MSLPPFPRILCAVDGTDESGVALEHAIALADGDAQLTLASVWTDPERRRRAWGVLELAAARAREAGVKATRRPIHAERVPEALAAAAARFDLLVVGTQPHSRASGMLHHEVMTALVHRCPVPLLVAREPPARCSSSAAGSACLSLSRQATAAGTNSESKPVRTPRAAQRHAVPAAVRSASAPTRRRSGRRRDQGGRGPDELARTSRSCALVLSEPRGFCR